MKTVTFRKSDGYGLPYYQEIKAGDKFQDESGKYVRLEDVQSLIDALKDCEGGLKYIREVHGELYGVGFDRALNAAREALEKFNAQPERKEQEQP
jgi:hypothetical protein